MSGQVNPAKLIEDDFSGEWSKDISDVFRLLNKSNQYFSGAINTSIKLSQLGAQELSFQVTVPPRFKNCTVGAGWTVVTQPVYFVDSYGWVHVRGTLTGGALGNSLVTGLPIPDVALSWPTVSNNAFGKIVLDTSGNLKPQAGSTTNVDFYVSYLASTEVPTAPSCFPIKIVSKLSTGQAGSVLMGSIADQKKAPAGTILYPVSSGLTWHNENSNTDGKNTNSIVIDNIQGLIAGHTYSVTLYALPVQ